ncbi:MAG: urease accessory protein UreF [Rhizobiales bacterium]|nr:urease accessory protein UreF [Hyphomicrobiales bacterium]
MRTSVDDSRAHESGTLSESAALYRLISWLSPSYPIGAFAYSHGLETAIEAGLVSDAATLTAWLADILAEGTGRNDALFLRMAYEAGVDQDDEGLAHVAELAAAFQPSAELALETTAQGRAFLDTTSAAWPTATLDRLRQVTQVPPALPVVVGCAAAGHGVPLGSTLHAYLHAFAANLTAAGVRLVPLGQTDGQQAIAAMEQVIAETASQILVLEKPLDHLASNTFINDWCSMRHETQYTRLFRS